MVSYGNKPHVLKICCLETLYYATLVTRLKIVKHVLAVGERAYIT